MKGRLLLFLTGTLLALAMAEIMVRALNLAPDVAVVARGRYRVSSDRLIGYEPIPGLAFDGPDLAGYDYRTRETNSLGYRDREHAVLKPEGVRRVVVLGDSLTMGLWISRFEDTFPARLEAKLQEKGVPSEVINFGVVGYNTLQEVATLADRGLRFDPDIVVLQYCLNDRERDDGNLLRALTDAEKSETTISSARVSRSLVSSAFYRFLRYRVLASRVGDYRASVEQEAGRLREDSVERSLRTLGEISRAHRFKVVLAVFPNFSNLEDYRFGPEHAEMQRIARVEGFVYLDLLNPMRECEREGKGERVSLDVYHPSVYGHECAARALSAAIAPLG